MAPNSDKPVTRAVSNTLTSNFSFSFSVTLLASTSGARSAVSSPRADGGLDFGEEESLEAERVGRELKSKFSPPLPVLTADASTMRRGEYLSCEI